MEPGPDIESTSDEGPAPKRKWLRRLLLILVMLPLALIILLASVPLFFTAEDVRDRISLEMTHALGVPVKIKKIDYSLLSGGVIRGVELGAPRGYNEKLLSIDEIKLSYDFSGILTKSARVKELSIQRPKRTIEKKNGIFNFQKIVEHLNSKKPKPEPKPSKPMDRTQPLSPLRLVLERFVIEDIQVAVKGEGPNLELDGISVSAQALIDQKK